MQEQHNAPFFGNTDMTKSMYARLLQERENHDKQSRNSIGEHKSQKVFQDERLMRESEGFNNRNGFNSVKH